MFQALYTCLENVQRVYGARKKIVDKKGDEKWNWSFTTLGLSKT